MHSRDDDSKVGREERLNRTSLNSSSENNFIIRSEEYDINKERDDSNIFIRQQVTVTPLKRGFRIVKPYIGIIFFVIYIFMGLGIYMSIENWSFIDTIYFIVVTTSTIGYGDLVPTSNHQRGFTVFYMFFGVIFVLPWISSLSFTFMKGVIPFIYEHTFFKRLEHFFGYIAILFVIVFLFFVFAVSFMVSYEDLSFVDALYWTTQTMLGIGYGDLALSGQGYRTFAVFFICCLLLLVASGVGLVQHLYNEHIDAKIRRRVMARRLTPELIIAMDPEGNGVEKFEFVVNSKIRYLYIQVNSFITLSFALALLQSCLRWG